jgi:hypothetical protein
MISNAAHFLFSIRRLIHAKLTLKWQPRCTVWTLGSSHTAAILFRRFSEKPKGTTKTKTPSALGSSLNFNLLNPTGHVMHQQFNIQQLYVLPTLYLCVLYLSENKQRLVPLTA